MNPAVPLGTADADGICIDGKKLYEDPVGSGFYRPEMQDFSQTQLLSDGSFQVTTKTGEIHKYGSVTRVNGPNGQTGIWPLDMVIDQWGNYFTVKYNDGNGDFTTRGLLPTRIDYTGHMTNGQIDTPTFSFVAFTYVGREHFHTIRLGSTPLLQTQLLDVIETPQGAYSFSYITNEFSTSLLKQIDYSSGGTKVKPLQFAWNSNPVGSQPQSYGWTQTDSYAVPQDPSNTDPPFLDVLHIGSQLVDLDADGRPDLVVMRDGDGHSLNSMQVVQRNSGNGFDQNTRWPFPTFLSRFISGSGTPNGIIYGAVEVPNGVIFADLDGDGKVDIIQDSADLTCPTPDSCYVCSTESLGHACPGNPGNVHHASPAVWFNRLTSTGGTWEYHPEFEHPPSPFDVGLDFINPIPGTGFDTTDVVADFNGDGRADIMVAHFQSESRIGPVVAFQLIENTGSGWTYVRPSDGSFEFELQFNADLPYNLLPQIADINRDGLPDVQAVQYLTDASGNLDSYSVTFLNKDGKDFLPGGIVNTPSPSATVLTDNKHGIAYGDLDGDGFYDVVSLESLWGINGHNSQSDTNRIQSGVGVSNGMNMGFGNSQSSLFTTVLNSSLPPNPIGFQPGDYAFSLVDVNGDGLADLVRNHTFSQTGYGELFVNNGVQWKEFGNTTSTWASGTINDSVPMVPNDNSPCVYSFSEPLDPECSFVVDTAQANVVLYNYDDAHGSVFIDLDGDGLPDIVKDTQVPLHQPAPPDPNCVCHGLPGTGCLPNTKCKTTPSDTASHAWINAFAKPTITGFPNALATATTVNYVTTTTAAAQSGNQPTYHDSGALDSGTTYMPAPVDVVQSVTRDTGIGGTSTSTYQYTDLRGSAFGYGSQGFKTVAVTDPSNLTTTTTYSQIYPFTGMATHVNRRNTSEGQLQDTNTIYCINANNQSCDTDVLPQSPRTTFFIHPSMIDDKATIPLELGSTLPAPEVVTTDTQYQYDSSGNTTLTDVTITTPSTQTHVAQAFVTETQNQYGVPGSPDQQLDQQMGKVTQTQVTYLQVAPNPTPQRVDTTQFQYSHVGNGLALSKKLVEPGAAASIELDTVYSYDKFGNLTVTTDCGSDNPATLTACVAGSTGPGYRTTTTTFDVASFKPPKGTGAVTQLSYGDGRFPTSTTDALEHTTYLAFDPVLGKMVQTTDSERAQQVPLLRPVRQ